MFSKVNQKPILLKNDKQIVCPSAYKSSTKKRTILVEADTGIFDCAVLDDFTITHYWNKEIFIFVQKQEFFMVLHV